MTRVVVDVDGVLADTHAIVIDHLNSAHGICIKPMDITSWDAIIEGRSITKEIIEVLCNREMAWKIPKIEGSLEGVLMLESLGFEIFIATRRGIEIQHYTQEWLIEYPFKKLIFTRDKSQIHADFLVDDYTKEILAFVENKDRVGILFDRPWNKIDRDVLVPYIDEGFVHLADNWGQVVGILTGLKKK